MWQISLWLEDKIPKTLYNSLSVWSVSEETIHLAVEELGARSWLLGIAQSKTQCEEVPHPWGSPRKPPWIPPVSRGTYLILHPLMGYKVSQEHLSWSTCQACLWVGTRPSLHPNGESDFSALLSTSPFPLCSLCRKARETGVKASLNLAHEVSSGKKIIRTYVLSTAERRKHTKNSVQGRDPQKQCNILQICSFHKDEARIYKACIHIQI